MKIRNLICFAALVAVAGASCSRQTGLGHECEQDSGCGAGLQCFESVCQNLCERHFECGKGFQCDTGHCEQVTSKPGDWCQGEYDCGAGQTCRADGICTMVATQAAPIGASCESADDCAQGTCTMATCSLQCRDDRDCSFTESCENYAGVSRCFPTNGKRIFDVDIDTTGDFSVELPETVSSLALIAESPHRRIRLSGIGNSGQDAITKSLQESALVVSTLPGMASHKIVHDIYRGNVVTANWGGEFSAWPPPRLRAVVRFGDANILPVKLVFSSTGDHPCLSQSIDPAAPQSDPAFQAYWQEVEKIMSAAGIVIDVQASVAISEPHVAAVGIGYGTETRLAGLFQHAGDSQLLPVAFVRSLIPAGVQALSSRQPGPPPGLGTYHSGVAVSLDTLCYRSPKQLARVTAHQLARHLGLPRSVAPDGSLDSIGDTDESSQNLMYFTENGGTDVTPEQKRILKSYPGLVSRD